MIKKKKTIWRIFRPMALVVVALVTSIFASKSPELSPIINAVGDAIQQVILVADNNKACERDSSFVDSIQTVPKAIKQNDSILLNS